MAVREHLPELIGLGSGPRPAGMPEDRWVTLPLDVTEPVPLDPTAGGALHWAPLREPGLRARTAALGRWAEATDPRALVVDVSVEIALAARLLSIPTVVVAQHGDRSDDAHRLAYRSASAVAALWARGADAEPPGSEDHLHHVGLISRFDHRAPAPPPQAQDGRRRALLMLGRGGHGITPEHVVEAVAATAGAWDWEILGHDGSAGSWEPSADEIWQALGRAHVVITPASNNCIAEVAAARRPLIVLPQPRPFGEQHAHAALLERHGLAAQEDSWPAPERWAALLDRASRSSPAGWDGHHDGQGARRLADVIERVAA